MFTSKHNLEESKTVTGEKWIPEQPLAESIPADEVHRKPIHDLVSPNSLPSGSPEPQISSASIQNLAASEKSN